MAFPPVLEKKLSYKNGKPFFFYPRENSEKWRAFPPSGMRGNGHHSLLLLRSSARNVDSFFHSWENLSLSPIGSDIWGWFFIKHQHETLSIIMNFTWDEGEILPVLGANFSLTIQVLSKRISFSGEKKRKGCPFLGLSLFFKIGRNAASFWSWTPSQKF